MAEQEELESMVVSLVGDGHSYINMLHEAQHETENTAHQVEETAHRIEHFSHSIEEFAHGALTALGIFGFAHGLHGAFEQFDKMENVMIRLETAIEANGESVHTVVADYKAFATEIANTTLTTKGQTLAMIQQAERIGVTGEAAKEATRVSIALAAATGQEAESFMRGALALQRGEVHYIQRQLGLRGIKDKSELVAKVQKIVEGGFRAAAAMAETSGGKIERLKRSLAGVSIELGAMVSEAIRPAIEWIEKFIAAFKNLDEGTRQTTIKIIALVAAIPLIVPALNALRGIGTIVFAPFISALTTVVGLLPLLLSPVGLLAAAVTAAGGAFLYFSGIGGQAIDYLTSKFNELVEDFKPAIKGIQQAISAGDLKLAFEIAWVQIKITFMKATSDLRNIWYDLVADIKVKWTELVDSLKSTGWADWLSKKLIDLGDLLEIFDPNQAQQMKDLIDDDAKYAEKQRAVHKEQAIKAAKEQAEAAKEASLKELQDLENKRAELLGKAQEAENKSKRTAKKKDNTIPQITDEYNKAAKAVSKFDAALAGSAEAISRAQNQAINLQEAIAGRGKPGEHLPGKFEATAYGSAGATAAEQNQANVMNEVNKTINVQKEETTGISKEQLAVLRDIAKTLNKNQSVVMPATF
jgi:hypothetical protein